MRASLLSASVIISSVYFPGTCVAQWQPVASGTTDSLTAITWIDGRYLIAGSGLTFLRSMDDGSSFSATAGYAPGFDGTPLDHLSFHDSLVGFGTSTLNCCAFQSTGDGGITWQPTFPLYDGVQMRIALDATNQVIFKSGAGVQFNTNGLLLYEPDAELYADLDSVCPVPGSGSCWVFVTGEDTTYSTGSYGWTLTSNDRGASIQTGTFPYASYLYSAQRVNDSTIAYIDYGAQLRVSHDKGVSWSRRGTLPIGLGSITTAFGMYNAAKGAFADINGQVHLTADSGMTWSSVPTPTSVPLNDLSFMDEMHLLAVGDAGTILSSSDGGYTWEAEESGTTERLHALVTSGTSTIAIGNNGTILRRYPAFAGLSLHTGSSVESPPGLELFPNPSSGTLHVRFDRSETTTPPTFTVIDTLGRKHLLHPQRSEQGTWDLDITHLANGTHILHGAMGTTEWKQVFLVVQ